MNRRQLLAADFSCVATRSANSQGQSDKFDEDTRPVDGEEELWFLLSAIDTLIFVMTGIVLREAKAVPRTIREFEPYGLQFANRTAFRRSMARFSHMKGKLGFETACRQSLLPRKEPLPFCRARFYPIR